MVFKEGLTAERWKTVFKETSRLSWLRTEMERLNDAVSGGGVRTASEQSQYLEYLNESTDILLRLYDDYASYLLSWSDSENCSFTKENTPALICGNADEETFNPLNGGMPVSPSPIQILNVRNEMTPSAVLPLQLDHQDYGSFKINLELKPEVANHDRYYTGNALVMPGSRFIKEGVKVGHFQYGYAELRF